MPCEILSPISSLFRSQNEAQSREATGLHGAVTDAGYAPDALAFRGLSVPPWPVINQPGILTDPFQAVHVVLSLLVKREFL